MGCVELFWEVKGKKGAFYFRSSLFLEATSPFGGSASRLIYIHIYLHIALTYPY